MKSVQTCQNALKDLLLDMYDLKRRLPPKEICQGKEPVTMPRPSYMEGIRVVQTAELFGVISLAEGGKLRSWIYSLTTEMTTVERAGLKYGVEIAKPFVYPSPDSLLVKPVTEAQILAMEPISEYPL
jgi:hypothetical protein